MKLYEIDSAIQAVYDQIEQNEGVLPDELESALDGLQMERTEKIENIIKLLKNIDGDITKIDVEISLLEKKLNAAKNRKQSVKNFLAYAIGNGNKFKSPIASCYWKESESVLCPDASELPVKYVREKITKEPDKVAIKEALNKGEVIQGCSIMHKSTLVVK